MYEDNFRKALFDALTPEYEQILNDATEEHDFSPKFERKMQKLIRRREKPYYKIINTLGKRIACIVVIILVASSVTVMSVEALRNAVADFFVSIYEKFSTVQSVEPFDTPKTIEDVYGINYDLSDYEVIFEEKKEYKYWIIFQKDDVTISFTQYTKDKYDKNINTENTKIETIDINGYDAIYFIDNQGYNNVIYDNEYYVIDIMSNIDKSAFIDIAESVQKAE